MEQNPDLDPLETREWIEALEGVLAQEGPDRAHFLIEQLIDKARRSGAYLPFSANTAYINTSPVEKQVKLPGDFAIEQRIRHFVRWNAMAMVVRANKDTNVGGHMLPCSASDTRGCFQDGGVIGRIPQSRLYANGIAALNIFPLPNFSAGSGVNYTSQVPSDRPRREDLIL